MKPKVLVVHACIYWKQHVWFQMHCLRWHGWMDMRRFKNITHIKGCHVVSSPIEVQQRCLEVVIVVQVDGSDTLGRDLYDVEVSSTTVQPHVICSTEGDTMIWPCIDMNEDWMTHPKVAFGTPTVLGLAMDHSGSPPLWSTERLQVVEVWSGLHFFVS